MGWEIAVLKDLVRSTCQGADICAAALQEGAADPYWRVLLEQLREDRRLLLVDLVRCLLLRGLSVPEVRAAMTEALGPDDPEVGFPFLRVDLEIAERKLEFQLRRVLADALVSQPTLELLSLHYLRLQMRLRELAPTDPPPPAVRPVATKLPGGGIGTVATLAATGPGPGVLLN